MVVVVDDVELDSSSGLYVYVCSSLDEEKGSGKMSENFGTFVVRSKN